MEIFIGLSDNRLTGTIPGDLILVPLAVLRVQNNLLQACLTPYPGQQLGAKLSQALLLLQGSANSAIGYEYGVPPASSALSCWPGSMVVLH